MKKHVFGFALFLLIVASFVFVYAFFSAPSMPSKEAVKPPVSQTETRVEKPYTCRFKKNNLSHEVISSQYFFEENKIVTKIRISLDKYAASPERVYVNTTFSSVGNIGKDGFGDFQILETPFSDASEKIITVVSKVSDARNIKKNENLYVLTQVTDYDGSRNYKNDSDLTQAKPVLFVYGKRSY